VWFSSLFYVTHASRESVPEEELRRRIEALLDCTVCLIVLNTGQICTVYIGRSTFCNEAPFKPLEFGPISPRLSLVIHYVTMGRGGREAQQDHTRNLGVSETKSWKQTMDFHTP
jgi:hypothetical protein